MTKFPFPHTVVTESGDPVQSGTSGRLTTVDGQEVPTQDSTGAVAPLRTTTDGTLPEWATTGAYMARGYAIFGARKNAVYSGAIWDYADDAPAMETAANQVLASASATIQSAESIRAQVAAKMDLTKIKADGTTLNKALGADGSMTLSVVPSVADAIRGASGVVPGATPIFVVSQLPDKTWPMVVTSDSFTVALNPWPGQTSVLPPSWFDSRCIWVNTTSTTAPPPPPPPPDPTPTDPTPTPTPTGRPTLDDPMLHELAWMVMSTAENSTTAWRDNVGYIEYNVEGNSSENRGYTGGIVGFTSKTHDMLLLVERYVADAPTNNPLAPYLQALRNVDGTSSTAGLGTPFVNAWKSAAANDPRFTTAQVQLADEVYFRPAVDLAKKDGIGPLGQLAYFDANVMHGWDGSSNPDPLAFDGIRLTALRNAKPPAQGGNETTYINAFLDARKDAMLAEQGHSDTSRVDTAQRVWLNNGNLDLTRPLSWSVYGDPFTVTDADIVAALGYDPRTSGGGTGGGSTGSTVTPAFNGLQAALDAAQPGQTIQLKPGIYAGRFTITKSGTASAPITLQGDAGCILDGGSITTGYGLNLKANYWRLQGFTIRNSMKGLMADGANNNLITGLTVTNIGDEGIHLRAFSSDNTVSACTVTQTGRRTPLYGEGIYVGSAQSGWANYSGGNPDKCDRNKVINNMIGPGVPSECVDIKEGTTGGTISGNTMDGADITEVDSCVDVKGSSWTVRDNVMDNSPKDGIQTHQILAPWGDNNVFNGNRVRSFRVTGGQVIACTPLLSNIVGSDNYGPPVAPTITDRMSAAYTDSAGTSSTYHLFTSKVSGGLKGLAVYLDGDGMYGHTHPNDTWALGGTGGVVAKAGQYGYATLSIKTPNPDGTFWTAGAVNASYVASLITAIRGELGVTRTWLVGYSGGSQLITKYLIPARSATFTGGGGAVITGGGGAPSGTPSINTALKTGFPMQWVTGSADDGTTSEDGYDALSDAKAGSAWYSTRGYNATRVEPAGLDHDDLGGRFGGYLAAQLAVYG